jgi:hypothetical protein
MDFASVESYRALAIIEISLFGICLLPFSFYGLILYRAPSFHRNLIIIILNLMFASSCIVWPRIAILWINYDRFQASK